jgi:hypothetical protein
MLFMLGSICLNSSKAFQVCCKNLQLLFKLARLITHQFFAKKVAILTWEFPSYKMHFNFELRKMYDDFWIYLFCSDSVVFFFNLHFIYKLYYGKYWVQMKHFLKNKYIQKSSYIFLNSKLKCILYEGNSHVKMATFFAKNYDIP